MIRRCADVSNSLLHHEEHAVVRPITLPYLFTGIQDPPARLLVPKVAIFASPWSDKRCRISALDRRFIDGCDVLSWSVGED